MNKRRIRVQYHFYFDLQDDEKIIAALDRASNKTEYIRRVIMADLEAKNEAEGSIRAESRAAEVSVSR